MNLMRDIDLKKIAVKMNGASGAELKVCIGVTNRSTSYITKHAFKNRKNTFAIGQHTVNTKIL